MHRLHVLALLALVAGGALLAYGAIQGDVEVGLFLIVPFLVAKGPAAALGGFLLFVALALWIAARVVELPQAAPADEPADDAAPEARSARHGGVVLIGPLPIVWGSDRRIVGWMVALGAALLALALLVSWALR